MNEADFIGELYLKLADLEHVRRDYQKIREDFDSLIERNRILVDLIMHNDQELIDEWKANHFEASYFPAIEARWKARDYDKPLKSGLKELQEKKP